MQQGVHKSKQLTKIDMPESRYRAAHRKDSKDLKDLKDPKDE